MARYYVEKDGEWNIFSTVVDDFLFDEFICLDALKARLLYERFKELTEDMDSLLTNNPRVNVMTYSEAVERKQADTPQTDCETCRHYKLACELFSEVCKYEPTTQTETQNSNLTFDTPQTESTGSPIGDYRDGVGAWQTDRMTEEEFDTKLAKVLVGQTDCGWGEPNE